MPDIDHVAKLSHLKLNPEESARYGSQLGSIIEYIDLLQSVDTKNVPPTFNVSTKVVDIKESSEQDPHPTLSQEAALQNAANPQDGFFASKGVFEGE